jgi:hypothetical protein
LTTAFDGPVDALCLSLQHFSELLASYPSIEPAMRRAAAEHMAEMAVAHVQGSKRRGR